MAGESSGETTGACDSRASSPGSALVSSMDWCFFFYFGKPHDEDGKTHGFLSIFNQSIDLF